MFWLIGLLLSIFWIWMGIDCLMNPAVQGTEKLIWVLVIMFLACAGCTDLLFRGEEQSGLGEGGEGRGASDPRLANSSQNLEPEICKPFLLLQHASRAPPVAPPAAPGIHINIVAVPVVRHYFAGAGAAVLWPQVVLGVHRHCRAFWSAWNWPTNIWPTRTSGFGLPPPLATGIGGGDRRCFLAAIGVCHRGIFCRRLFGGADGGAFRSARRSPIFP